MSFTIKAFDNIPSFGIIPQTFPRDVTEFDTFHEQMAIGQILEPLVTSDQFGNVAPALASKWEFLEDGNLLRFYLRTGAVFSTGETIEANDVMASLTRHWKNPRSQSFPLLQNIESMAVRSRFVFEIKLKKQQLAILKIFGRDHLGIMPADYKFFGDSVEPYIGSGPYRLLKTANEWHLQQNDSYHSPEDIPVVKWRLYFVPNKLDDLATTQDLPSYAPVLTPTEAKLIRSNPLVSISKATLKLRPSFAQFSAWWNPHGKHFKNNSIKKFKMSAVRKLIIARRHTLNLPAAFGFIPKGVVGCLLEEISFPELSQEIAFKEIQSLPEIGKISIAISSRTKSTIADNSDVTKIENELGITFIFHDRASSQMQTPAEIDVIMGVWAGAFNDPEGFVPILKDISAMDLTNYLEDLAPLFEQASTERDLTKRAEFFCEFDRSLVASERMVPGFRIDLTTLIAAEFKEGLNSFRYTPKILGLKK